MTDTSACGRIEFHILWCRDCVSLIRSRFRDQLFDQVYETYKQRQGKQWNIRFTKEEAKKNFTEYIQHEDMAKKKDTNHYECDQPVSGNFINCGALLAIALQNSAFKSIAVHLPIPNCRPVDLYVSPVANRHNATAYIRVILCPSLPNPDQPIGQCIRTDVLIF